MHDAAHAALLATGHETLAVPIETHHGLIAEFGRRIVQGGKLEAEFGHSLNRISATMNTGQKTDLWLRSTVCFRMINGKWLIVHTQVSVPVDLATGRAVLDLKP